MPDSLCRIAVLSSNISVGLLSAKSINNNFFKDLLFKLTGNFKLFTSIRSINNIAIKDKRIGYKIPAMIKYFFKEILQRSVLYLSDAFNTLKGYSHSLYS